MSKLCGFIRNCVEKYIPMIAFSVLFVVFVYQIFVRYILTRFMNISVPWTVELEQSCFLWLVMLGACYAQRVKGHVTFTLLYDNLNTKGKAISAMLGNLLVLFTCLTTFLPSLNYVWGLMERQQITSILKWPKTVVFFPYVVFLAIIAVYTVIELFEEIMVLAGNQRYIDRMLSENVSEAEQAIEASLAQDALDLSHVDYEEKEDK